MTTATLPNGVVSTRSYDNANRLTGISHVKNGTTLASASYTVDAVGNRSDRTDLAGTQTYGYDNLYRLTSVTYPGPTTTTYSYDAFGNRTQKVDSSGTTTYAYDDADRITSVTPPSPAPVVSYTWDNNGNLTNRGSDSFSWDYEDRMTSATVGGTTWSYAYRGDGLRDSATSGGTTRAFTWDINAGLPVILDDGAKYIYGAGIVAQVSGANTYYYLADGLGSTMATTDASGAVVNSYTYDVYGKTTASSGTQANGFQFAGQQTDPTGLQYLRARYYDPETGGFLSRDPLAEAPGWLDSPFTYSRGNPASQIDPTGLWCPRDPEDCVNSVKSGIDSLKNAAAATGATLTDAADAIAQALDPMLRTHLWYRQQSTGMEMGAAGKAAHLLKLVGEYAGKIAAGCVTRFVDCYFAFEHLAVGAAIIAASIGMVTAACEASAGAFCLFAIAASLPALAAGMAVVTMALEEFLNLRAPAPEPTSLPSGRPQVRLLQDDRPPMLVATSSA